MKWYTNGTLLGVGDLVTIPLTYDYYQLWLRHDDHIDKRGEVMYQGDIGTILLIDTDQKYVQNILLLVASLRGQCFVGWASPRFVVKIF